MAAQQDIETRLGDILECVAQIHRREASAQALAARVARAAGDFSVPPGSTVVSFNGRPKTSIALTLVSQFVRLPACERQTELWVTALPASERARIAIDLQLGMHEADPEADSDTPAREVRLLPFTPHRLVTLEADSSESLARIARTEGNLAVLMLELAESGSERAAELAAAAAAGEHGNDTDAPRAQALEPSPSPEQRHSAAALDRQLWGGYAALALPQLEGLKFDPGAAPKERVHAAWCLARWHFVARNFAAALAELRFAKSFGLPEVPRWAIAEARCLLQVDRCKEAFDLLQKTAMRNRDADRLLLEATAARRLALQTGATLEAAETIQLDRINRVLAAADLEPIARLRADEPLSLANVGSQAQSRSDDQSRKVSVVMSAFNAADSICWALGSVLAQTWQNLEIIVVDDASEDDTAQRVADIAANDARIRLIRLEENRGSYFARNAGARLATGDLLMVHDADDWSHPQYIERQIEVLDEYPSAAGVMSHWVRVNDDLEVVGTWIPRDSIFELNFSSLMFRRELLEELGGWDEVRVAGDAEFYSRFRAVYGEHSVVTAPRSQPLAFALTRQDSLTRTSATHLRTMYHGLRREYMDAYRWWHARLDRERDLPIAIEPGRRPFPFPLGNSPKAQGAQQFDLVVIADYSRSCAAFDNALSALIAGARDGRSVAALHWRHYESTGSAALQSEFFRTCLAHGVEVLSAGDSLSAGVVIIASPALLEVAIEPRPEIRADEVAVLVDCGPKASAGTGRARLYDARRNLVAAFGQAGRWLPTSAAAERLMRANRRYPAPSPGYWRPMVDVTGLAERNVRWRGGAGARPVVGRRIVGALDWPSRRSELDVIYGANEAWDVRFHTDNAALIEQLRDAPEHWEIVPRQAVSGVDFCDDLDFYVHYPHELHADELSQGLLDALAMGIPVIVPPRYAALLGDAASYAVPERVAATLESLWADEQGYLERAAAGRRFALGKFAMAGFLDGLSPSASEEPRVLHVADNAVARAVPQVGWLDSSVS